MENIAPGVWPADRTFGESRRKALFSADGWNRLEGRADMDNIFNFFVKNWWVLIAGWVIGANWPFHF